MIVDLLLMVDQYLGNDDLRIVELMDRLQIFSGVKLLQTVVAKMLGYSNVIVLFRGYTNKKAT